MRESRKGVARNISIHAPPRGATNSTTRAQSRMAFQFTPLREGRRIGMITPSPYAVTFQFTPLREGRRDVSRMVTTLRDISIHAPPRGATPCTALHGGAFFISIHAPPRGATAAAALDALTADLFQFTPLREGRHADARLPIIQLISIHAPPRGATFNRRKSRQSKCISIHAPPRGATRHPERRLSRQSISIHAPPRGATQTAALRSFVIDFNSRPSARGDFSCKISRE